MVSRYWQNCLEGPQNCPQGRGFCLFSVISQKFFCPGAGNLTTLKNSPGVSPGGGCWCLELTDALCLRSFDAYDKNNNVNFKFDFCSTVKKLKLFKVQASVNERLPRTLKTGPILEDNCFLA